MIPDPVSPEPDDSARYWSAAYDRPGRDRTTAPPPGLPTGGSAEPRPGPHPSSTRSPEPFTPDNPTPRVRTGSEALGDARRYVDAVLMAGFGILCFVAAGSSNQPFLAVLVGIFAIGYAGYIALLATSYTMPLFVYAIAVFGGLWLMFG